MVNAMICISDRANRVLNVVKARYGFRDKSQAIERVVMDYEKSVLEPAFRPEFVDGVLAAKRSGKFKNVASTEQLFE
ncbi:MAG: DUF2683 family protein [Candidatus Micrarchaeia archaeon]|jgi:hypothetical protein